MTGSVVTLQTSSSTVLGIQDERFERHVWYFRGIPYGHIPERFHKLAYVALPRELDATKFGPQCPQPKVDVGHLLRLPRNVESPTIEEDEFKCLNLNISRPTSADIKDKGLLPVLVWIHGGSQCVTYASAASPVCDPTRFVAESVDSDKPIIVVTFNYRLNIFAFGDGEGERNLALQDQRLALQWVSDNIRDFGGDPGKITLAGESAGAVYVHAHVLSKTAPKCVQQAIMASGSLHLSPPQPLAVGQGLLKRITAELQVRKDTLHNGSADSLVQALVNCGVTSMWLQEDPDLDGWENRAENVDGMMISDVEYESAIWKSGIDLLKTEEILEIIRGFSQDAPKLEELYHIYPERPVSSRLGALDIINDARFAIPALEISERWRRNNKRVYQYIVDEANPWQASSRAHHAVDLIFLFGGIDLSLNPGADRVGKEMRQAWVTFMYGGSPWPESSIQAYGPYGNVEELDLQKYKARRRVHCFDYLQTMGTAQCRLLSGKLGAGRVSLLN
ncbi:Carboxylic ester hydrolase [Fusarium sp. LHS14.1]|nr:Carboxylic ester hydrolase [Fusarium sp. LHS14.1]